MVRVRIGDSWKQDPALQAALARGGVAAREAARDAVDAIALEVDGVDLGAGRAEGPLLAGLEALGEGVLHLLAGNAHAQVHFSEGGIELVLGRRGSEALVTVVALSRPARVLARDIALDLAELARATRDAAADLAGDLGSLGRADPGAVARPLLGLVERLDGARAAPIEVPVTAERAGTRERLRRENEPTCEVELDEDGGLFSAYRGPGSDLGSLLVTGRVLIRAADGRQLAPLEGPPFLLLRDLVAFAGTLAEAASRGDPTASVTLAAPGRHATLRLDADLARGTIAREDGAALPCPPLLLARAMCEAAIELCDAVVAGNAAQEQNGWLVALRGDAADRLAHVDELIGGDVVAEEPARIARPRRARTLPRVPLGPGRMRRVAFRRAWSADVGSPAGPGLALAAGVVVAMGASAVVGLDPASGEERWRTSGVDGAWLGDESLFVADGERLAALDPATGRERWSIALSALPGGRVSEVVMSAGGAVFAVGPGAVTRVDLVTARPSWTFAPPAALTLRAAPFGPLAIVGSDAGFLYALDTSSGRTAWRLRLPGPPAATPMPHAGSCLVLCERRLGGSLLSVEPGTGRRQVEVPLDVTPSGAPVALSGLLAIPGTVAGDPVVIAVAPAGRLAWEDAPLLGPGRVALTALSAGVLAKTARGASVALGRSGETLWLRPRACDHPPAANVPAIVARGVALLPSERVEVLDLATGRLLGQAPIAAPVRLVASAALDAWAIDAEGLVTAVRLETHLSVV